MGDHGRVEMIRIPREEEVYDREAVLGRDVTSVFPNAAKQASTADSERVKEIIGASNFISESQLEELKAAGAARVEDGAVPVDKSLAEILAENKAKEEAEFKAKLDLMKQGKNRPLDEDEADFLGSVVQQAAEVERAVRMAEQQELAAFREALQQRVATGSDGEEAPAPAPNKQEPRKPVTQQTKAAKAVVKPMVKVRAKGQQQAKRPKVEQLVGYADSSDDDRT